MKTFFSLCLFLFISTTVTAQYTTIFGNITDTAGLPLAGATISFDQKRGTLSNSKGNFLIQTKPRPNIKLTIRYIGYESIDTSINIEGKENVFLNFKMKEQLTELPKVEITAEYINIFEDYPHHLIDFTISNDFIYLIIEKGRKSYLGKANLNGTVLEEHELIGGYRKFYNSCLGGIILTGKDNCAELHELDGKLLITNEFSIDYYEKYIVPCKLKFGESLIFKNVSKHNKKVDYYQFEQDKHPRLIYTVFDEDGAKVAKSYFNSVLRRYFYETENVNLNDIDYGFERENIIADGSWNGDLMDLIITNETHERVLTYQALGLKPVNSDLFVKDQQIFILDDLNKHITQVSNDLDETKIVFEYDEDSKISIITDYQKDAYFNINDQIFEFQIVDGRVKIQKLKQLTACYFKEKEQLYKGTLYRMGRKSMNTIKKHIFRDTFKK